jgi:predicted nucleic acid-binding protein
VNEFVIKETRRTLKALQISQENINYAVDHILECCIVRKNVPKKEFSKFKIRDKNDIPILAGAAHESAVLVTEDGLLKDDSKGYVESVTPGEALQMIK